MLIRFCCGIYFMNRKWCRQRPKITQNGGQLILKKDVRKVNERMYLKRHGCVATWWHRRKGNRKPQGKILDVFNRFYKLEHSMWSTCIKTTTTLFLLLSRNFLTNLNYLTYTLNLYNLRSLFDGLYCERSDQNQYFTRSASCIRHKKQNFTYIKIWK